MWYIVDSDNNIVGSASSQPDLSDLASREEKAVESDLVGDLEYDGDAIILKPPVVLSVEEQLAEMRQVKLAEIHNSFTSACSGSVECIVNSSSYVMDTNWDDPVQLKGAIDLAVSNNETSITLIDFYDNPHPVVSLDDALEVARQMGNNYQKLLKEKAILQQQIKAVEIPDGGTIDDAVALLDEISWII